MKTAITKKLRAGTAFVCSLAVVAAAAAVGFPDIVIEADAADYFYAPATLYDYKYDTEVQPSYTYKVTQSGWDGNIGGNRWQNGSQVPYELLNRKISDYYGGKSGSIPALYFGNFWGSSSDCWKGEEQQYTIQAGTDRTKKRYYDEYNNFCVYANNAPKSYDGYTPVQNLVDASLKDFDLSAKNYGTLTQNNNGFALPQFDDTFISDSDGLAEKFEVGNGFPFDKNLVNNKYYMYKYDSLEGKNRYYNKATGNFEVQSTASKNYRSDNGITSGERGFYPFNGSAIEGWDRSEINYGFGMRVDIPFTVGEDGYVVDKDNNKTDIDTVFEFSGDDDVWVFVDGKLLLDLGGDHARATGSINFRSQEVYITDRNGSKEVNPTVFSSDYLTESNGKKKNQRADATDSSRQSQSFANRGLTTFDYGADKEHVLTVFYMERGMFESNLKISFNFVPKGQEVVQNESKLTIREQTVFDDVNPGLLSYTKAAADKDVFHYTLKSKYNEGGSANPYYFPTYALNATTDVYRKNTEAYGTPQTKLASYTGHDGITASDPNYYYVYFIPRAENSSDGTGQPDNYNNFISSGFDLKTVDSSDNYSNRISMSLYETVSYNSSDYPVYVAEIPATQAKNAKKIQICRKNDDSNYSSSGSYDYRYEYVYSYGDNQKWNQYTLSKKYAKSSQSSNVSNVTNSSSKDYKHQEGDDTPATPANMQLHNSVSGSGATWTPVNMVSFGWNDQFKDQTVDLTGITTSSGEINLLYGQEAIFKNQFTKYRTDETGKNTQLQVVQSEDLYKHDGVLNTATAATKAEDLTYSYHNLGYSDSETRDVSDYYTTTVSAVDIEGNLLSDENYNDIIEGSTGSANSPHSNWTTDDSSGYSTIYNFRNKNSTNQASLGNGEASVQLTETFINAVKVKDIKVTKQFESGDSEKEFTFKVEFNDIFGVDSVDIGSSGDYSKVSIEINAKQTFLTANGEFTISKNDTAVIKGIPVGTKCTITEVSASGYAAPSFVDSDNNAISGGVVTVDSNASGTIDVVAKNKIDASYARVSLVIEKRWVNSDEGLDGKGNVKNEELKLLLQRKLPADEGWEDVENITLVHPSGQDGIHDGDNTTQEMNEADYLWQYTKENLVKYKNNVVNDDNLYIYRVLEYAQNGTALLLATGGNYTQHCLVTYDDNTTNGKYSEAVNTANLYLTNTFDIPASIPKAGAEGTGKIIVFGITAITLAGAALMIYKKKIEDGYIIKKGRYMK